jgi:hypothetical protein
LADELTLSMLTIDSDKFSKVGLAGRCVRSGHVPSPVMSPRQASLEGHLRAAFLSARAARPRPHRSAPTPAPQAPRPAGAAAGSAGAGGEGAAEAAAEAAAETEAAAAAAAAEAAATAAAEGYSHEGVARIAVRRPCPLSCPLACHVPSPVMSPLPPGHAGPGRQVAHLRAIEARLAAAPAWPPPPPAACGERARARTRGGDSEGGEAGRAWRGLGGFDLHYASEYGPADGGWDDGLAW